MCLTVGELDDCEDGRVEGRVLDIVVGSAVGHIEGWKLGITVELRCKVG